MLSGYDWLRRCPTGAELLATLKYLREQPDLFLFPEEEIGPPQSALDGSCQRCWIYPRMSFPRPDVPSGTPHGLRNGPYCQVCRPILVEASRVDHLSYHSVVIWGLVNQLPRPLVSGEGFRDCQLYGAYIQDAHHFLLMMHRRDLKPWLQELGLYHGAELKGLIQVLPTTGSGKNIRMDDVLCRAAHQEARFPMDSLRVRFFSAPHQLMAPHERDRQGLLTFDVAEFLSLLEMAAVFRTLLRPELQQTLRDLLNLKDASEALFYWGRFLGYLSLEAKDMLNAWKIRSWPKSRVDLLYELVEYVAFYQPD
jgi:hypothetical protein